MEQYQTFAWEEHSAAERQLCEIRRKGCVSDYLTSIFRPNAMNCSIMERLSALGWSEEILEMRSLRPEEWDRLTWSSSPLSEASECSSSSREAILPAYIHFPRLDVH